MPRQPSWGSRFTLSRTTAGDHPVGLRGDDPHDLRLRKVGALRAQVARVPETLPGGVADWRGTLTRGRWELSCSLPGHKRAGMKTVLTVK